MHMPGKNNCVSSGQFSPKKPSGLSIALFAKQKPEIAPIVGRGNWPMRDKKRMAGPGGILKRRK